MKGTLQVSIVLNLVLVGSLISSLMYRRPEESAPASVSSGDKPSAPATAALDIAKPSGTEPASFHWSQLVSANDYRLYVANLRALGCPEPTIEDIVRGDTDRVFSWERSQLALNGSGNGPWSQAREMQLVARLLGGQPAETNTLAQGEENSMKNSNDGEFAPAAESSPGAGAGASLYPLFLQNVNWNALGFTADQQAAIAQVRRQFQSEINGVNQPPAETANQNAHTAGPAGTSSHSDPNDAAALTPWQTAQRNAADQLQSLLGAQGYAAYEQQQYYAWYQPQVLASAGSGNLTINPEAFASK